MKKYLLLLSALIIGISSCKKDSPSFNAAAQAATDDGLIKAYITANNINATKDASGLYYSVVTPGTGAYPTASSTVSVNYSGKLLNGSVFSPLSNLTSPLSGLIKGWQIGIPHINDGGRILLIIPSGLAYGNSSPAASIPANSVLVFTIDLISFTN
ncbi:MAG TPA: FKBP-type peptidyl-prolyl cis-trans isomerase [Mucilaginibacter sp.]|jgi:FKBP-type peptidyl-prolyl cis-trans isomerase